MKIEVCKGEVGLALYVDDKRVAGARHNGLMKTILSADVPASLGPRPEAGTASKAAIANGLKNCDFSGASKAQQLLIAEAIAALAASPAATRGESQEAEIQKIAMRLAELHPSEGLLFEGGDYEIELRWLKDEPTLAPESARGEAVAWRDVLAERRRQIVAEGWTPEHDDGHAQGEMADAAALYASLRVRHIAGFATWPWSPDWFKPKDRRRDLVKAGALILAEIERLDRKDAKQ